MGRAPATDTTCPSCDAPAPAGARSCSRCGYRFLEAGGGTHARRSLRPIAVAGGVLAVVGVAAVLGLLALSVVGSGDDGVIAGSSEAVPQLDILSEHPLPTPVAERLLKRRYLGARIDESSFVGCSARIPKPAHSVRRCIVHYPGGGERRVVLITSANGAEVISKP